MPDCALGHAYSLIVDAADRPTNIVCNTCGDLYDVTPRRIRQQPIDVTSHETTDAER